MTYLHNFYNSYLAEYRNKENIQLPSLLEIFVILPTWIINTIPGYEIALNFYKVHEISHLLQYPANIYDKAPFVTSYEL